MGESVVVGRLAGAFGVRGEVRLKSFCAEPAAIAGYAPLVTPDGRTFPALRITGEAAGSLTARVEGIATREEAEALKGTDLPAIKTAVETLSTEAQQLGGALYNQEEAAGAASAPGEGTQAQADDEIVDAEIVDDEKK